MPKNDKYNKKYKNLKGGSLFTCNYDEFNPLNEIIYTHWLFDNYPSPENENKGNTLYNEKNSMICHILNNNEICHKFIEFYGEDMYNKYTNLFEKSEEFINKIFQRFDPSYIKLQNLFSYVAPNYVINETFFDPIKQILEDADFRSLESFMMPIGVSSHAIGTYFKKVKENNEDCYIFYIINSGLGSNYHKINDDNIHSNGVIGFNINYETLKEIYTLLLVSNYHLEKYKIFSISNNLMILTIKEFYYIIAKIAVCVDFKSKDYFSIYNPEKLLSEYDNVMRIIKIPMQNIGNCTLYSILYVLEILKNEEIPYSNQIINLSDNFKNFYNETKKILLYNSLIYFNKYSIENEDEKEYKTNYYYFTRYNEIFKLMIFEKIYTTLDEKIYIDTKDLLMIINNKYIIKIKEYNKLTTERVTKLDKHEIDIKSYNDKFNCSRNPKYNSDFIDTPNDVNKESFEINRKLIEKIYDNLYQKIYKDKFNLMSVLYDLNSFINILYKHQELYEEFFFIRYHLNNLRTLIDETRKKVEKNIGIINITDKNEEDIHTIIYNVLTNIITLEDNYLSPLHQDSYDTSYERFYKTININFIIIIGLLYDKKYHDNKIKEYNDKEKIINDYYIASYMSNFTIMNKEENEYLINIEKKYIEKQKYFIFCNSNTKNFDLENIESRLPDINKTNRYQRPDGNNMCIKEEKKPDVDENYDPESEDNYSDDSGPRYGHSIEEPARLPYSSYKTNYNAKYYAENNDLINNIKLEKIIYDFFINFECLDDNDFKKKEIIYCANATHQINHFKNIVFDDIGEHDEICKYIDRYNYFMKNSKKLNNLLLKLNFILYDIKHCTIISKNKNEYILEILNNYKFSYIGSSNSKLKIKNNRNINIIIKEIYDNLYKIETIGNNIFKLIDFTIKFDYQDVENNNLKIYKERNLNLNLNSNIKEKMIHISSEYKNRLLIKIIDNKFYLNILGDLLVIYIIFKFFESDSIFIEFLENCKEINEYLNSPILEYILYKEKIIPKIDFKKIAFFIDKSIKFSKSQLLISPIINYITIFFDDYIALTKEIKDNEIFLYRSYYLDDDSYDYYVNIKDEKIKEDIKNINQYYNLDNFDKHKNNCIDDIFYGKKIKKYIIETFNNEVIIINKDRLHSYNDFEIYNQNIKFTFQKNFNLRYISYSLTKIYYEHDSKDLQVTAKSVFRSSAKNGKKVSFLQLQIKLDYNIINNLYFYFDSSKDETDNIHTADFDDTNTNKIKIKLHYDTYECFYNEYEILTYKLMILDDIIFNIYVKLFKFCNLNVDDRPFSRTPFGREYLSKIKYNEIIPIKKNENEYLFICKSLEIIFEYNKLTKELKLNNDIISTTEELYLINKYIYLTDFLLIKKNNNYFIVGNSKYSDQKIFYIKIPYNNIFNNFTINYIYLIKEYLNNFREYEANQMLNTFKLQFENIKDIININICNYSSIYSIYENNYFKEILKKKIKFWKNMEKNDFDKGITNSIKKCEIYKINNFNLLDTYDISYENNSILNLTEMNKKDIYEEIKELVSAAHPPYQSYDISIVRSLLFNRRDNLKEIYGNGSIYRVPPEIKKMIYTCYNSFIFDR